MAAYDGVDLRKKICQEISPDLSVVDLCCGSGYSTVPWGTGVDTSDKFLQIARFRAINIPRMTQKFEKGNAETWGETNSFDVVTCMFATHEMPRTARLNVLRNAKRIARKKVIFVDLDPNYTPSEAMLEGEPYILEYRKNIDSDFRSATKR